MILSGAVLLVPWRVFRASISSLSLATILSTACLNNGSSDPTITPFSVFSTLDRFTTTYLGCPVIACSIYFLVTFSSHVADLATFFTAAENFLTAIGLTSTSSTLATRVGRNFNFSGRTQGSSWLTPPRLRAPITFYYAIPCCISSFHSFPLPGSSLFRTFLGLGRLRPLFHLLPLTIFRPTASLSFLADRTFALCIQGACKCLPCIYIVLFRS